MKKLSLLAIALCASLPAYALEVSSTSIEAGKPLAEKYVFDSFGCKGGNLSPQLSWKDAPEGTKSFAITAYDPDAPTGSGWWHWVVYNIPASVTSIEEGGSIEGATEGRTDFGAPGYGGACPPEGHGVHHYTFTVFALDTEKLDLPPDASGAMVGYYLNNHMLDKASITATYERTKAK